MVLNKLKKMNFLYEFICIFISNLSLFKIVVPIVKRSHFDA